ncbi:hypothetical protein C4571_02450 [Candidatus Parcubacteria bacterium]|nr:MAG: hypothetical protein C4571_02450 [Candidatus Parcubacteria bacterium]
MKNDTLTVSFFHLDAGEELNGKGVGKTEVFPMRSSRTAGFVGASGRERRETSSPAHTSTR